MKLIPIYKVTNQGYWRNIGLPHTVFTKDLENVLRNTKLNNQTIHIHFPSLYIKISMKIKIVSKQILGVWYSLAQVSFRSFFLTWPLT